MSIHDQMLEFLSEEGFDYERHDEQRAVRIDHQGTRVEWGCVAQVWEDQRVFVFYSVSPLRPTPTTFGPTSEFVHRANIGVLVGNFELDLDDGVKVNYEKFQGVEVPRDDGKGSVKMDLLGKI